MYTYLSTRKSGWGFCLLLVLAATATAQDPVKLPEVRVKGVLELPGPRILAGIVVDTAGNPIPGAEIIVEDPPKRLKSGLDGTFRFDSVWKGKHTMRARKLGFAPQVREFRVDSAGGVAIFALTPLPRELPAMVSAAVRPGLSGVVADTAFNPIPGARVRALGINMETRTDSAGAFWMPVPKGSYMVSVSRDSFADKVVGVTIPPDSGRKITAWLRPKVGETPTREVWNIEDLRERQAWITESGRSLFTRERLEKDKIEWIFDAVQMSSSKFFAMEGISRDCMAVVNGGPASVKLSLLTIDEVESVEIYPHFITVSPTITAVAPRNLQQGKTPLPVGVQKGGQFSVLDNTRKATFENQTRNCLGVYVWLR